MLAQVWQFMKLPFPGTDIPVGALLVMPTIVGFAVRFIKNITGVGGLGDISQAIKMQSGIGISNRIEQRQINKDYEKFLH